MTRVTFKGLKEKCTELNKRKGVKDGDIGSYVIDAAYGMYAVEMIINQYRATRRLYGYDSPKKCMEYLNRLG